MVLAMKTIKFTSAPTPAAPIIASVWNKCSFIDSWKLYKHNRQYVMKIASADAWLGIKTVADAFENYKIFEQSLDLTTLSVMPWKTLGQA